MILAQNGKALLPIVLCPEDVNKRAAEELAHYLFRITGANFDMVESTDAEKAIRMKVDPALAEETLRVKVCPKGLTLSAGSLRGLFYAVYALLEDILGVGFYTYDVTKIPSIPTLELADDLDYSDKPALEFRQLDNPANMFADWRAHNRLNGPDHNHVTAVRDGLNDYGGFENYSLFVHTFRKLIPPEVYFDEHPEYFSLIDGQRLKERSQLCLTNPEVLALAIEKVKENLREHPEATIISVSQNDWYNPCQCPECAAIDEAEGSHAGTLLRFVNAIAEAIEPEFPHITVDTLAYQYTRTPPKITKPRHNVCVRLCSIECCFGHPLETCDWVSGRYAKLRDTSRASFQEDLIGWGKICDRIYIWDYVTNFRHYWLPFPNFHVLGPNMQFFVKNGVKGVHEEANYQSMSPDVFELRGWLMAKLLWNPDFDVKKGIYDFTEAVYGPAAAEVRAYLDLLEKRVTEGNIHFGIYESPAIDYLDADTLGKALELIGAAQAKCLNLSQRLYIEKIALTLEFVQVGQDIMNGKIDTVRIDNMMDKGRTLGLTMISEGTPWHRAHWGMLEGLLYRKY